ncbi:hypothetical protein H2248_008784 [Termitomyces sp. 'cryptogamus']|nr:hypothetical protein H2248_008784 [Termitomyces sp. 'cryptogamus']
MSFIIEKDQYIVIATKRCDVQAENDQVASEMWFCTPALEKHIVDNVISIQLETRSHDQGWVPRSEAGWSWFDVVVLQSPEATQIKVKDGLALMWMSHENKLGEKQDVIQAGPVLLGHHDIFASLEVGNALGVLVCARFPDWENHASEARLILRVPERDVVDARPRRRLRSLVDRTWTRLVSEKVTSLMKTLDKYLDAATPGEASPAYSLVREMLPTGPLRADQVAVTEEPPLKLLSFDGGGVRGISSLYILQAIMMEVSPNDPNVKPCKYFDMICGTSAGGLIAIMLGRLQMTIPECINVFESLALSIFSADSAEKIWNFTNTGAYYKADNFEKVLKKLIEEKTGDENAPMLDSNPTNNCKVSVVSGRTDDLSERAEHFRTYSIKFPDPFAGCSIWQAARATSAAPLYLPPITINNVEFVDGGMMFNNPSILLMGEVNAVYGFGRRTRRLLSIGTGMQPLITIDSQPSNAFEVPGYLKALLEASKRIVTDCERTHELMVGLYEEDKVYYRFNAGVKVGDDWAPAIALDDYQGMPKMVDLTETYLKGQKNRIAECAEALTPWGSFKPSKG